MTVQELIHHLEHFHPDLEVRIGTRPVGYPAQASVAGVTQIVNENPSEDEDVLEPGVVLVLQGEHRGYLTRSAWGGV